MLSNSAGRTGNCDLGPDPTLSTRVAQRMVKRRRRAQGRSSTAVLERCCPRDNERLQAHDAICTDFFAARPRAMNDSAWLAGPRLHGRVHNEWAAALVFRAAIDRGRATVWDVEEAYRSPACRVGGRGVFHDHAYCGEIAAPSPVPVQREAQAARVVVVVLAAWAFARLLCATTRVRRRHQPS